MDVLSITELKRSEVLLRRAHHVLGWIMHFYIHSLPPDAPVVIPPPITLPVLQVSAHLQLPPVLTYSDDVLYNWDLIKPSTTSVPALDNLRCQTLFTSTTDESEFYLTSARIELKGVDALDLMQNIMDEAFVGDSIAHARIASCLTRMSVVIQELRAILLSVREGCDPTRFYHEIRPWFRGADSDMAKRKWVFEGIELDPSLHEPTELSGPSAGQSSLIHALDVFLCVDRSQASPSSSTTATLNDSAKVAFLDRMRLYMPRHHRKFLHHLSSAPRPLRELVLNSEDPMLLEAYNGAVKALKEFRDAHMKVVAMYIIGPSRRPPPSPGGETMHVGPERKGGEHEPRLKGTGGTDLVRFLKDVRDRTAAAIVDP
jgi:indoleamine 2,3-dioxygenase